MRAIRVRDIAVLIGALLATAAIGVALRRIPDVSPTTAALALLLVVLATATLGRLWIATVIAVVAMLTLNFFFLPPVGTFTIADPQNWVALFAFLVVAVIASNLSAHRQARARRSRRQPERSHAPVRPDAGRPADHRDCRRHRCARPARGPALRAGGGGHLPAGRSRLARPPGRRQDVSVDSAVLNTSLAKARGTLEFDAASGPTAATCASMTRTEARSSSRCGTAPSRGAARRGRAGPGPGRAGRRSWRGGHRHRTHAIPGEREAAELVRQKADLAATLLASLSHDLKTPLTAIRVAVENLRRRSRAQEREEQAGAALMELDRLTRLFQDILDMARIDAAAIHFDPQWVTPADVVDAASAQVRHPRTASPPRQCRRADRDRDRSARRIGRVVAPARERRALLARRSRDRRRRPGATRRPACRGYELRPRPRPRRIGASVRAFLSRPHGRQLAPGPEWGSPSREAC